MHLMPLPIIPAYGLTPSSSPSPRPTATPPSSAACGTPSAAAPSASAWTYDINWLILSSIYYFHINKPLQGVGHVVLWERLAGQLHGPRVRRELAQQPVNLRLHAGMPEGNGNHIWQQLTTFKYKMCFLKTMEHCRGMGWKSGTLIAWTRFLGMRQQGCNLANLGSTF